MWLIWPAYHDQTKRRLDARAKISLWPNAKINHSRNIHQNKLGEQ